MICAARQEDAGDIAVLWNWMITETLATFTTDEKTPDAVTAMIAARPGATFVAREGGALLGVVTFGPFRGGPGYAATCEHSVIVRPQAQGKGVGRGLLQRAEQAAREQGKHVMVGGLSGANAVALRFHLACGFHETGRLPQVGRKAGQWLDLVFVQKILSSSS